MVYQTYSAEFKINVVKEFLIYHGTLVSYCRLKNIKVSTFYPWLRKYRDYNNGLMDITNEVEGYHYHLLMRLMLIGISQIRSRIINLVNTTRGASNSMYKL